MKSKHDSKKLIDIKHGLKVLKSSPNVGGQIRFNLNFKCPFVTLIIVVWTI